MMDLSWLPENWREIAVVLAIGVVLWLRSQGANPALDRLLVLLRSWLKWPESDPLAILEERSPAGLGARAAVFARLRKVMIDGKATDSEIDGLNLAEERIEEVLG